MFGWFIENFGAFSIKYSGPTDLFLQPETEAFQTWPNVVRIIRESVPEEIEGFRRRVAGDLFLKVELYRYFHTLKLLPLNPYQKHIQQTLEGSNYQSTMDEISRGG